MAEIWQRLVRGGHIYHDVYQSWYCVQDEAFLTELQTEVKPDGTRGNLKHPSAYFLCQPIVAQASENQI